MAVSLTRRFFSMLVGIVLILTGIYVYINPNFVPFLVRGVGFLMLLSGVFLSIEGFKLPTNIYIRNSWIVDSILMIIVGLFFILAARVISVTVLGSILLLWFFYTAILQIWVAIKISTFWIKWLVIILSVLVMCFSLYAVTSISFLWSLLYFIITYQFIFLGIIRFFYGFITE